MPPKYQKEIGKLSFKNFVLQVAYNFGDYVNIKKDSFYRQQLKEFKNDFNYILNLNHNDSAWIQKTKEYNNYKLKEYKQHCIKKEQEKKHCQKMIEQVNNWQPPTPEHVFLKTNMVGLLNWYIKQCDIDKKMVSEPKLFLPEDYYKQAKKELEHLISMYVFDIEREDARINRNKQWIKDLRESLEDY